MALIETRRRTLHVVVASRDPSGSLAMDLPATWPGLRCLAVTISEGACGLRRPRRTRRPLQRSCRRLAVAVQRDGIAPAASAVTECDESGDTAARVTVDRRANASRQRCARCGDRSIDLRAGGRIAAQIDPSDDGTSPYPRTTRHLECCPLVASAKPRNRASCHKRTGQQATAQAPGHRCARDVQVARAALDMPAAVL
jgi:hypothetical protein